MMRSFLQSVALVACAAALGAGSPAGAATLNPLSLNLPKLRYGAIAWAPSPTASTIAGTSYVAMTGMLASGRLKTYVVKIAPGFGGAPTAQVMDMSTGVPAGDDSIPGVVFGSLAWADFDGDGRLDLAIAGRTTISDSGSFADTLHTTKCILRVYRQQADGYFKMVSLNNTPTYADAYGVDSCTVKWVDYNVDGYVDLFVTGRTRTLYTNTQGQSSVISQSSLYMFRNTDPTKPSTTFQLDDGVTSRVDQITPLYDGDAAWADMNGDGTPDLVITGRNVHPILGGQVQTDTLTQVYVNDPPGVFTLNTQSSLDGQYDGGVAWGDFNGDGVPDIIVSGRTRGPGNYRKTWLYENLGNGNFVRTALQFDQRYSVAGKLVAGDFNNDGRLDFASVGDTTGGGGATTYYENMGGGTFTPGLVANGPPLIDAAFSVGHFGNDGTLDLVETGYNTATGQVESYADSVTGVPANEAPTPPTLNQPTVTGSRVLFTWNNDATDLTDGGTVDDANRLSYELLMYSDTSGIQRMVTVPASFGPGPQGWKNSYIVYRTLAAAIGMPVRVRSVDMSGVTSPWSSPARIVNVQDFVNSDQVVLPVRKSAASWVDIDNDGGNDLVVSGASNSSDFTNRLYLNPNGPSGPGQLVPDANFNLPGISFGAQAWGDFNGDGYLDELLAGSENANTRITSVYLNEAATKPGTFALSNEFEGLAGASIAVGDLNNDGKPDFVVTGVTSAGKFKTLFGINEGPGPGGTVAFDTMSVHIPFMSGTNGLKDGWITLEDYDKDGRLDITFQGDVDYGNNNNASDDYLAGYTEIYHNDGDLHFSQAYAWPSNAPSVVSQIAPGDTLIDQLSSGQNAWADVNGDGWPDFIEIGWSRVCSQYNLGGGDFATGNAYDASALRIYENDHGKLKLLQSFPGLWNGASLAVGDIDGDGDVDILVNGNDDHELHPIDTDAGDPVIRLYRNDGTGHFTLDKLDIFNQNRGGGVGSIELGDIDNDGDLDLAVFGETITGDTSSWHTLPMGKIFTNTNGLGRIPPEPTDLVAHTDGDTTHEVHLTWSEPSDFRQTHFTYTVRVGTAPGLNDVRPGDDPVGPGSLGYITFADLNSLKDGVYYWSARTVDNAYERSDWAPEQRFTIDTTPPRVSGLRGDTLSVAANKSIGVTIAFYDSLTGVDTTSAISVKLALIGLDTINVVQDPGGWQSGSVWVGSAPVADAGSFVNEPISVRVSGVRDVRGNVMRDTTITTRLVSSVSTLVSREAGAKLVNTSGTVSLYVPPRAFNQDLRLSVTEPDSTPTPPGASLGLIVEIDASEPVGTLNVPAMLTFDFSTSAKLAEAASGADLHVFRVDTSSTGSLSWEYLGGEVNPAANTISVPIHRLGVFGLFEASANVSTATLSDLSCTPRAFSPGSDLGFSDHTDISFTVASADAGPADVKVYNDAGRLVWRISTDAIAGLNTIAWDGLNVGGHIVPSGLYIVVVKVAGKQQTMTVLVQNKYARTQP